MNYISIDAGAGYWKFIRKQKQGKFANLVGNYKPSTGGGIGDDTDLSIQVDGLGEWNFGETAELQSSGRGRRPLSDDRIFTKAYLAGMLLAISECYEKGTHQIKVDIIAGLPGSQYEQYADKKNKTYQKRFKNFIQGKYIIHRDTVQHIEINSIQCTNQGWGSIWRHLIDKDGNPVKPDIDIDVVDIAQVGVGHQTVEIATVRVTGIQNGRFGVKMAEGIQLSEPNGIHLLIKDLRIDLLNIFGQSFSPEQAIKILENGGFVWEGEKVKYKLPSVVVDNYNNIIYDNMKQVYKEAQLKQLYRFINTGGGANITKDRFAHIPQLLVSDKPQWDTVVGYDRLGKLIAKRSK